MWASPAGGLRSSAWLMRGTRWKAMAKDDETQSETAWIIKGVRLEGSITPAESVAVIGGYGVYFLTSHRIIRHIQKWKVSVSSAQYV